MVLDIQISIWKWISYLYFSFLALTSTFFSVIFCVYSPPGCQPCQITLSVTSRPSLLALCCVLTGIFEHSISLINRNTDGFTQQHKHCFEFLNSCSVLQEPYCFQGCQWILKPRFGLQQNKSITTTTTES